MQPLEDFFLYVRNPFPMTADLPLEKRFYVKTPLHSIRYLITFSSTASNSFGVDGGQFVCLFVGFYGTSTLLGYLMPNPFLCK